MYMADPIDAMILHVQGSGRVQVQEPGGQTRTVRMAFAGTNNQPFKSPSAWVTAQGGRGGSWDNGAGAGLAALSLNGSRVNAGTDLGFRPAFA